VFLRLVRVGGVIGFRDGVAEREDCTVCQSDEVLE
jgi:hypothetical protein